MTNFTTWIATIVIVSGVLTASEDVAHHLNNTEILLENDTKVLSRAKRYLTFPDGSSFQLVFCTQTHGYLQVGDIVWFGNTAALAWELPSDPQFFTFLKQHSKDFAQKRQDLSKHIYYLDDTGKVISKVTYKRKPIVNPAFAKRSVDNADFKSNMVTKAVRDKMHDVHKHKSYLQDLDKASIEFHKTSRKNLYEKLEIFLEAVGWRGRECVLRMLCEARGVYGRQGSFFEEILKATFTLPQGRGFDSAHDHYDTAHETGGDCAEMYPECRANHNVVKPIVNPAFAKRSVDNADFKSNMVTKAVRDKMHDVHKHKSYLQDLDKASIEFHKTSRKNLYEKLEIFLEAVGWRGRECVLRMLCEARGVYGRQGSFFEEILKATFTLPQGRGFDSAHDHYDTAHETGGDCAEMYPECRANHNVV